MTLNATIRGRPGPRRLNARSYLKQGGDAIHLTDSRKGSLFFFSPNSPFICRAVLAETARVDQRGQSGVGDVGDGRGLGVTQEFGLVGDLR